MPADPRPDYHSVAEAHRILAMFEHADHNPVQALRHANIAMQTAQSAGYDADALADLLSLISEIEQAQTAPPPRPGTSTTSPPSTPQASNLSARLAPHPLP